MCAAWESMSDDAYDAQESRGEAMGYDFYDAWYELDGAIDHARVLRDALAAEDAASTGLHEALVEIGVLLDRAAAA